MSTFDETLALCALNRIFGYHPALAVELLAQAGGSARGGFRFLSLADEDYPSALRECPAPPLGLYLNGTSSPSEIFEMRPMVAFVGTRDLSPYGKAWCEKLVKALSETRAQPVIVSGLALGADGVAHRTALECGLPNGPGGA